MTQVYKYVQCGSCGCHHAIPLAMWEAKQEEGGYWHCPNGHQRGFREGRMEREAVIRERDRLKQQLAQRDDEIARLGRQVSAAKGEVTKVRNRAKAGVCPCCNRTFSNMAAHMKTKHPDFDPKVVDFDEAKASRA